MFGHEVLLVRVVPSCYRALFRSVLESAVWAVYIAQSSALAGADGWDRFAAIKDEEGWTKLAEPQKKRHVIE